MTELYVYDLRKHLRRIDVFYLSKQVLKESSVVVQLFIC